MAFSCIGVVGAGAWGLALAIAAQRAGRDVRLWGREGGGFAEIRASRRSAGLADALQAPNFRLYDSDDRRGVEIGGAAKNVLAIACGAAAGLQLGASASAALVARGFAELQRFGAAFGGRPATLMGLAGLGELVLTCASPQSRNFAFGFDLGRGVPPERAGGGRLVEGAQTAPALTKLARARGVDMPIAEAVERLLGGAISARAAVE